MSKVLVPSLALSPCVTVRRRRELPLEGKLLCAPGDTVGAAQVVARAYLPGDLIILRLPEKMGIEPGDVMRGLRVAVGAEVSEGSLLCEHVGLFGWFKTRFYATTAGVVEFVTEQTGHLGVRLPARPLELDAYLSGTVVEVETGRAVTVEAQAALVQGIFGVGGERRGVITLLNVGRDQEVQPDHIPVIAQGAVLVGGMRASRAALECARERGAVGFVTGSIDDAALAGYLGYDLGIALTGDEQVSMSVIVTEGFGAIPFSERAYAVLAAAAGRDASLSGATQVRAGAVRPEIVIPGGVEVSDGFSTETMAASALRVGAAVRLIRVPYFGMRAIIAELPHAPERIETGALTRVLRATLESGETVTVPRANVELC